MHRRPNPPSYDNDFVAWALHQADSLKHQRINYLDFENIAEEIEGLAKKHKRELKKRLIKLMAHLLKWEYQPEMRCKSWSSTIYEQRSEIEDLLSDNPSMRSLVSENWAACFEKSVEDVLLEIGLYTITLPSICPWNEEEVLKTLFNNRN